MKKLVLELEYQAFPIWEYQDEELLGNHLPAVLQGDRSLKEKLDKIQEQYDALFIGIERSVTFTGWHHLENKAAFLEELQEVIVELKEKLGLDYQIVNEIEVWS